MINSESRMELESYLRLNHASPREWQAALRTLYGSTDLHCDFPAGDGCAGALSSLDSEAGQIVWLHASQDMDISGWHSEPLVAVVVTSGEAKASWQGQSWSALETPVIAYHRAGFRLHLCAHSEAVFVRPEPALLSSLPEPRGPLPAGLKALVESFLVRARMFVNDRQARSLTTALLTTVARALATGQITGAPSVPPARFDRRLVRAIEKIRHEPEWEFDLHELASHAGVSERNLYYLMKRQTGMTPYRYFQRCRLLRVRQQLVDCQCPVPHISWYAANEGFSHLGRFSALYREHFGELPSETVGWRRRLLIGDREATTPDPVS